MARNYYDVIVVGARCAGASTAMLLARRGYRVLAVDRARFPSDTVSTHLIHTPGIAALRRWGLLDRLQATGCPAIRTYSHDFGAFVITGSPAVSGAPASYAPRRTVLDALLLDAASAAGVEVREGFAVTGVLEEKGVVAGIRGREGRGREVAEGARVVVGADGVHSFVARTVRAGTYREKPRLVAGYYSYWSRLPMEGRFENFVRPRRGFAAWPTNDDLTLVIAGWPFEELEANRGDIEGTFMETLGLAPAFAARVRAAKRRERFRGASVPNRFRKPFGPGWALVGDAGYNRDFITAQGIADAFQDAELCADALDSALSGRRPFAEAMGEYHSARDARVSAMYEFTAEVASLEPPPPPQQRVLKAVSAGQEEMDAFVRVTAGVLSPEEFFAEENVKRILAAAEK